MLVEEELKNNSGHVCNISFILQNICCFLWLACIFNFKTSFFYFQELEREELLQQAEKHYVDGSDWKLAVNMYRQKVG